MKRCIEQWYPKSPGVSKVLSKLSPGDIGPESNDPSSAVTVCSVVSSFVHNTILFPSNDDDDDENERDGLEKTPIVNMLIIISNILKVDTFFSNETVKISYKKLI